jgi:hypothetical protein
MPQFEELPQQIIELECSKIVLINPLTYGEQVPSTELNNLTNCYINVISSVFGTAPVMDASSFQVPLQDDWIPQFDQMREITQQWPGLTTIRLYIDTFYERFRRFLDWIRNNPNTNDYVSQYKLHLLNIVHDPT